MLYELRQYRAHPGRRDEFVELMESTILPYQRSCGVQVVSTFVSTDDPDVFVWMRRFDSEAHRTEITEAMYNSAVWLDEMLPRVIELLDRSATTVTMLTPTDDFSAG